MNLKQLEYFVRVADGGSFMQATSVRLEQPASSQHVRRLEVGLKQALFTRDVLRICQHEGAYGISSEPGVGMRWLISVPSTCFSWKSCLG